MIILLLLLIINIITTQITVKVIRLRYHSLKLCTVPFCLDIWYSSLHFVSLEAIMQPVLEEIL